MVGLKSKVYTEKPPHYHMDITSTTTKYTHGHCNIDLFIHFSHLYKERGIRNRLDPGVDVTRDHGWLVDTRKIGDKSGDDKSDASSVVD
ncbi:unnamed protein product [Dovyalis caffra]|uniref:Uncharacterized protein n=1 Tax=Dovyalis caffra TaxID=77055 RepID=A0AAV1S3J7_9ROSI|nr:unnamed protein product [Dovyalis caffra]